LIRRRLLQSIIAKLGLTRPRVDTNLGKKGKPSKRDLDEWKMRRARKANEQSMAALRKRRGKRGKGLGVLATKRKWRLTAMARFRACPTCGDYHFRRTCYGDQIA